MAKKDKVSGAAAAATQAIAKAATSAEKTVRGLKGVELTARITLLVPQNPKREGSKSYTRFNLYKEGMTCGEALAAGVITPDLAYDTAHGFIGIEGYSPILVQRKERPVKAPKAPKAKKGASPEAEAAQAELAALTQEESID